MGKPMQNFSESNSAKRMPDYKAKIYAKSFFSAYDDPEISKRLYFDFWADQQGLMVDMQQQVWHEVVRLTLSMSARKREKNKK